jgi:RNA polymerase sigma-70 factor (ECF subfamily)
MMQDQDPVVDEAKDLLARARTGDREALGSLMEQFRGYLLAVAGRELADRARAKLGPSDVVQDTFVEGYRVFAGFRGEGLEEFRGWLRTILRHKVAEQHDRYLGAGKRRADREVSFDQGGPGGPLRDALPGPGGTPSGAAVVDEELRALFEGLDRLPEPCRQVIVWRQWERLPFAEIGRRLGRGEEAARKAYVRGLERLRGELERR